MSSGLRECSRLRLAIMLTRRRPGGRVRAFLPRVPKQDDLGHVAEIEADAAPSEPPSLRTLCQIRFDFEVEAPGVEDPQPVGQQRVQDPEIAMRDIFEMRCHRQGADRVGIERRMAAEPAMFGRDLAGAVDEAPWRIGQHRAEAPTVEEFGKFLCGALTCYAT